VPVFFLTFNATGQAVESYINWKYSEAFNKFLWTFTENNMLQSLIIENNIDV